MKHLISAFQKMDMKIIPSAANFITLVFKANEEAEVFTTSMFQYGIILRHLASWGLPNCVRITIGTEEENQFMIKYLSKMLFEV